MRLKRSIFSAMVLLAVFSFIYASAESCIEAPEGLVSWWTGDGSPQDEIGDNSGILLNGAGFAAGIVGPGFSFDGVDDYLDIGDRSSLDFGPNQDFTIDAWIMTLGSSNYQNILDKRDTSSSRGYLISVAPNGRVVFWIKDNDGSMDLYSTTIVNDGGFHHIAITIDRDGELKIFIDGQLDGFTDMVVPGDVSNPGTFTVGRGNINNPPSVHKGFHGTIDELRVFSSALSEVEIQEIFNSGSEGACFGAPLPTVPWGGEVEVLTRFHGRPGEIAITSSGDLYAGNFHFLGQDGDEVPIFRVEAGTTVPVYCGAPIPDPDIVLLDHNGTLTAPGNLIVGSLGRLSAVESDCGGVTILAQGDPLLGNPQDMDMDALGRLVYFDHVNLFVGAFDGSSFQVLVPGVTTSSTIAVDESDLYLTPEASETPIVRKYDLNGNLVDGAFTSGLVRKVVHIGGRKGLLVERSNTLVFIDLFSLEETLLLENLFDTIGYEVDADGYLFLTQMHARRLLKVVPSLVDLIDISGAMAGLVLASCPAPGTPLLGVTVDVYDNGGDLVASELTDADGAWSVSEVPSGDYGVSVVAPLGYTVDNQDLGVSVASGHTVTVDFSLTCQSTMGNPRGGGFWKHQVGVATGGRGNAQVDTETLCGYLDLIEGHFNSNEFNQVIVYDPPAEASCEDKLLEAKRLLNLRGHQEMIARARQHLMALLLNVSAGHLALFDAASEDGATISQAITFCDGQIDDPPGDLELAKDIVEAINKGQLVGAGLIPLETDNIAYRIPGVTAQGYVLDPNQPNPFNPATKISYSIPGDEFVSLVIYSLDGRVVKTLVSAPQSMGRYEVIWNGVDNSGRRVASGTYLYGLKAGGFTELKKMTLVK